MVSHASYCCDTHRFQAIHSEQIEPIENYHIILVHSHLDTIREYQHPAGIKVSMKCWSPKFWTSVKLDVISMQLLQTVEDSCKNWNKKKICKYFQFWGENMIICEFFLMFKNFLKKDLLNVLMIKLQTIDIYLGHRGLVFLVGMKYVQRYDKCIPCYTKLPWKM